MRPCAYPQFIGFSIESKLRRSIEFITKDMGRPLQEISRNPSCLSISLDQRLKPRYHYMMEHGKRHDFSLSRGLS